MAEKDEKVLYECECFRVLRYPDESGGGTNIAVSLFHHGIDLYMDEDEFSHLVEVLGGLEHIYASKQFRH